MKQQIETLRQKSYNLRFGSRVAFNGLKWNPHDDDSFHFGAMVDEQLVSTVRLTRVSTNGRFETMLQFPAAEAFSKVPCYVLSRAATAEDFLGRALNMALRVKVFHFLVNLNQPDELLFGAAIADSRRLSFLSQLGYEVLKHDHPWRGYLDAADKKAAIFKIRLACLPKAIATLEESLTPDLRLCIASSAEEGKLKN